MVHSNPKVSFICLFNNEGLFDGLVNNLRAHDPDVRIVGLRDRGSITSGYNEAEARLGPLADGGEILGFIHQDARLHFDVQSVIPHYFAMLDRPGILGFAGTDAMPPDGRWWAGGRCYGGLLQGGTDARELRYMPVLDHQLVEVVDGYCLFVRRDVFRNVGRFDERFDHWHFYDADLCLSALIRGYRNFVIAQRSQHFSPGSYDELWERQRKKFLEKWGSFLAIPKEHLNFLMRYRSCFSTPEYRPVTAWAGHAPFAMWLVESLAPRVIVELGVHHGYSYMCLCQAVEANALGTRCYGIDTWAGDPQTGPVSDRDFETLRQIHDRQHGRFSTLVRMTFDQASELFDDGSIDLIHFDGLHTYEALSNDWVRWRPKLSRSAVALFHDIQVERPGFGVGRFFREHFDPGRTVEFEFSHGLGVAQAGEGYPLPRLFNSSLQEKESCKSFFRIISGRLSAPD